MSSVDLLSKEAIFESQDMPSVDVRVPEWGGRVRVKSLTAEERDAFEEANYRDRGPDGKANLANLRARLCVRCMIDNGGNPMFDIADIPALGRKSAKALDRVFRAAQDLNGLGPEDIDEMVKN